MKDNKMKLQLAKGVKDIPSETKIIKKLEIKNEKESKKVLKDLDSPH